MDWTTVITTILAAPIPTGGVAALFTVRERKTELTLDNMAKINEQWASFSERDELRRKELKEDLERKDRKIDELYYRGRYLARGRHLPGEGLILARMIALTVGSVLDVELRSLRDEDDFFTFLRKER